MQDLIEDNAQGPHIHRIGVIMKLSLFRRNVLLRPCYRLHDDLLRAEPEVSQFYERQWLARDVLGLEQYILRLQVAMGDAVVVQLLHAFADLQYALQALLLVEFVIFLQVERVPTSPQTLPQRTARAILGYVPHSVWLLDDIEYLKDVLVLHLP